jgi:hypothetical protein
MKKELKHLKKFESTESEESDTTSIEFNTFDGFGNKKCLDISKHNNGHLELQIIDSVDTKEETIKFYILTPDKINQLKKWLNNM